jgi:Flp pilus assembly protein TadG
MISTLLLGRDRRESGQAAVEALLVIMLMALLIFGGIELSQGVAIRQALDSGTAAAVRALALDPAQWSFSNQMIQQSVDQNVMGRTSLITLRVYDSGGTLRSSAWLSGSNFGTAFILEASAPFDVSIPFLMSDPVVIQVRHWGIVERYP